MMVSSILPFPLLLGTSDGTWLKEGTIEGRVLTEGEELGICEVEGRADGAALTLGKKLGDWLVVGTTDGSIDNEGTALGI